MAKGKDKSVDTEAEAELARQRRSIRVVNETGMGKGTRILRLDGEDITDALRVTKVELTLGVNTVAQAVLHVIALHGKVDAEVVRIEKEIVPPAQPKEQIKVFVGEPVRRWFGLYGSRYRVERWVPVHAYADAEYSTAGGALITPLADGWMAPIGPLELAVDA